MKSHSPNGLFSVLLGLALCLGGVAQGADSPEDIFWKSVSKSNQADEYQLYIEQYPKGKHIWEARGLIKQLEAQEFRPGKVFKDCADCPEMVVIPAGSFDMGGSANNDEKPIHQVTLKAFALGKTEVTQRQWRTVMGINPSKFSTCGDNCPVERVSWDDAQEYVRKLSQQTGKTYRLPSEAEWEYACRAGGNHEYCGGDDIDTVAWINSNSGQTTHPAAGKQANTWGLYDMSGNVWEWTQDCWTANYNGAPSDGSARETGLCSDSRVLRGGSWNNDKRGTRVAYRSYHSPKFQDSGYGFRLVRMLP